MEKQEGRDHFGYGRDCAVSHGRPLESSEQIESQVKSSSDFYGKGKDVREHLFTGATIQGLRKAFQQREEQVKLLRGP